MSNHNHKEYSWLTYYLDENFPYMANDRSLCGVGRFSCDSLVDNLTNASRHDVLKEAPTIRLWREHLLFPLRIW